MSTLWSTPHAGAFFQEAGAPELRFQHQLGCLDCGDDTTLTPAALAVLDYQRVAVLDRYEPFVRVFEPDGTFRLAFGGRGEGPGDLGIAAGPDYIGGIYILPDWWGGMLVMRPLPAALDRFDARGRFVERTPLDLRDSLPHAQAFSAGSRVYYRQLTIPFGGERFGIYRCLIDTGEPRECTRFIDPSTYLFAAQSPDTPPPNPRPAIAATLAGGLVMADPATYRLWRFDESGEVTHTGQRNVDRASKSDVELENERALNDRLPEQRRRPVDLQRPHLRLAGGLQTDHADRVWVLTERHQANETVFDVFTPELEFLGAVTIDARVPLDRWGVTPFIVRDNVLVAIVALDDGNNTVNVYEIVESGQ